VSVSAQIFVNFFEFLGGKFFVKIGTHTDHFSQLLSPKNIELLEKTRGENIFC